MLMKNLDEFLGNLVFILCHLFSYKVTYIFFI